MPSYVDFDSTRRFRDYILGKNLSVPNGPQTFNAGSYTIQNLSDTAVPNLGDVEAERVINLDNTQNLNIFKPLEYFVRETLDNIPRRANLALYPYFRGGQNYNIIGIMSTDNYDTESELFKFAAFNIRNNPNGPVFARIQQNLYAATVGRARIVDALQGNSTTAINIITGREPLIEYNNKITVAKTVAGKAIDFIQTVAGVEFPWSEVPGDYLTNPRNPINVRPQAQNEAQALFQDITGAIGSLVGIQRRPKASRKPSDLFIEYMGEGQRQRLYDLLSYSKYAPNYTTTARSQQSSKIFSFVDKIASGVKSLLGLEAPKGAAYIGDDRGNDVKFAMNDFNDRPVRSNYFLVSMFDPIQADLFQRKRNITEGGPIAGKLTWISSKSKNKIGANNKEFASEQSQYSNTLSTSFRFRDDSILGVTQDLLNTLPTNGKEQHSHVANVIDQTSRVFREGGVMMSRGSNVKYVDKFSGEESGVEYCRVWTKDRSHMNYSDTMKRTGLIRKYNSSVLSTPYNINIYPNSDGKSSFDGSTNIVKGNGGFYAKKYMFSIENLAWKTSNIPGFTYNDLPYCERGNNGGRVMWFPPYDLKVSEQNSAKWEENTFLGRPEPIFTYQNTTRNGSISFKIVVDHPSILNLLVREHFKGMSDEEADNYIHAFFAGCEDLDFYSLIRKYTTLEQSDIEKIQKYLSYSNDPKVIDKVKVIIDPVKDLNVPNLPGSTSGTTENNTASGPVSQKFVMYFKNDYPKKGSDELQGDRFKKLYEEYQRSEYIKELEGGLVNDDDALFNPSHAWGPKSQNDYKVLYNEEIKTRPDNAKIAELTGKTVTEINKAFDELTATYSGYTKTLSDIKGLLKDKKVQEIKLSLQSSTSFVADDSYNLKLSYRRSSSLIKDVLENIKGEGAKYDTSKVNWKKSPNEKDKQLSEELAPIKFRDLGYDYDGELKFNIVANQGEQFTAKPSADKNIDCHNKEVKSNLKLKRTAPLTFYCREATIVVEYKTKPAENPAPVPTPTPTIPNVPNVNVIPIQEQGKREKPPLDELKRIIMKTLGECYYFKQLEESSPVAFSSLKEKLKYFHPGFHSTTPEGLNARLTFVQQCIRPGDTIPIKGISDETDLPARNTTFGPPPICILRIGDFYHSKVIIRDVNITYDNSPWDLNPEGIGIQPMIADVSLQVSFIGGHGMEKPVERLQNALSSNFYANTEVYDYRATATEDRTKFNKEELEKLTGSRIPKAADTIPTPNPESKNNVTKGEYLGTVSGNMLNYDKLIQNVFTHTTIYYDTYDQAIKKITKKYGSKIASTFFSPTYRVVKDYDIQKVANNNSVTTLTVQLFGQQKNPAKYTNELLSVFRVKMNNKLASTNITTMFGLDDVLNKPLTDYTETYLKPIIADELTKVLKEAAEDKTGIELEEKRNELISNLDKLNYIIETTHDAKILEGNIFSGVTFDYASASGFTKNKIYSQYEQCIEFIDKYDQKMLADIDSSLEFSRDMTITDDIFKEFVSLLLYEKKQTLLDTLTKKDSVNFNPGIIKNIDKKLTKFFVKPTEINVKLGKYPTPKNTNKVEFQIVNQDFVITGEPKTNLIKLFSAETRLGDKLNYYRKKK